MTAGRQPVAPSAIAITGDEVLTPEGKKPYVTPHELRDDEIPGIVAGFAAAAAYAKDAGFDGVELHGANGYLLDQFLNSASNQRTDAWGGSVDNRIRFVVEVARAVTSEIGGERTGIRISPYGVFNGMAPDAEMDTLYLKLVEALAPFRLVYLHVVDHSSMGAPAVSPSLKGRLRQAFKGAYILSGGYDLARAEADLAEGKGDLVAFGRPFIANPDLVTKLKTGKPLAQPDFSTFYTPGEKGYTDYK
jgi:N-ethylmaleimide reductase